MKSPEFVRAALDYVHYAASADDLTREVVCTPYGGAYHGPAGYVITITGTPPRVVIVVVGDPNWINWEHAPMCFVHPDGRHFVRWLDPFNGSKRQQDMRVEIIKVIEGSR